MAVRFGGKERRSVIFYLVRSESPGIVAYGDVKANRVNRVASAVGEGPWRYSLSMRF
jgi:hypothetical protein